MNMKSQLVGCCALLLLFLLNSCGSSKITGQWKDPELGSKKYSHILVIGVAKHLYRRQLYEYEYAKQLNHHKIAGDQGAEASIAWQFIPGSIRIL